MVSVKVSNHKGQSVSYRESRSRCIAPGHVEVVADNRHFTLAETLLTADLFGHDRDPDFNQRQLSPLYLRS